MNLHLFGSRRPDAFTKSFFVGAALGLGAELLVQDSHLKGWRLLAGVVTAVALQAIAHYLGLGAAVGCLIGLLPLVGDFFGTKQSSLREIIAALGLSLVGGTLGYLIEFQVYPLMKG